LNSYRLRAPAFAGVVMLRRPEGARVDEVANATVWQRHTVPGGDRNHRSRNPDMAEVEGEIAGLVDRSAHEP